MNNINFIRDYFITFFNGKAQHSQVRSWLTDDFKLRDPMMSADSADEYVQQLQKLGNELEMYADIKQIAASGDIIAALVEFQGPHGPMLYSQWFTLRDGKIANLQVIYDPRPFLDTMI